MWVCECVCFRWVHLKPILFIFTPHNIHCWHFYLTPSSSLMPHLSVSMLYTVSGINLPLTRHVKNGTSGSELGPLWGGILYGQQRKKWYIQEMIHLIGRAPWGQFDDSFCGDSYFSLLIPKKAQNGQLQVDIWPSSWEKTATWYFSNTIIFMSNGHTAAAFH